MKILKKTTKYFSIRFEGLHFKDLLNFTCPMSLDKYLKTWTTNFSKLTYPYEFFESVEQIRAQKTFPLVDEFRTTLKGDVDLELYEKCKTEFDRRINLNDNDPEKWYSFECYLRFYNLSDVLPASFALIMQFKTYCENFKIYPLQFLGLPSFAKAAMYKLYNKGCPSVFTFPKSSNATKVFRDSVIGGLTNVYKRHVTLEDEEDVPFRAKYNVEGK